MKFRIWRKIFVVIGILIPSVLAGLRDYSIGTDVNVYGNAWFDNAVNSNKLFEYIIYGTSSSMGVGYLAINYIVSRFTDNAHWFYFALNLLTNSLIYKALKDNEDIVDLPIGMLCYYLFFYNQSLNLLRQSLAIALVACTFVYIRKKQWIKYVTFLILAVLTHSTAILAVFVFVIYNGMKSSLKSIFKILIILGTIIFVVFFSQIINVMIQMGVLSSRYEMYISTYLRGGGIVRLVLFCVPYMILFWGFAHDTRLNKSETALISLFKYLNFISTVCSVLAFRMTYLTRMLYYFDIFMIMAIPYMSEHFSFKVIMKNKNYTKYAILIIPFIYWLYVFGIQASGETVPYVFMGG